MDGETIQAVAQLGGTVFTVALFIWYLMHKNGKHERAWKEVSDGLNHFRKAQEKHTRVLINVSKAHGLIGDADDLTNDEV